MQSKYTWLLPLLASIFSLSAWAQSASHAGHSSANSSSDSATSKPQAIEIPKTSQLTVSSEQPMDHSQMKMQGGDAPADARDPHAYSDGLQLGVGQYALSDKRQLYLHDEHSFASFLMNRLEWVHSKNGNATVFDGQFSYGTAFNKFTVKAEGEAAKGKLHEARTEFLWGHAIAPYWDSQLGIRLDKGTVVNRQWLAFGVQGIAPYWFDVDATAYVGNEGRTALRLGATYDLLINQRLILQPRAEINLYGKDDSVNGIGRGLSSGVVGMRLRYEFSRQFAPYVGVERTITFGKTADMARASGEKTGNTRWIAGVRFWF
ncbi:copper resistance protein B [Ottowia testudinis]|uniref:Copper resistance protein B n=1 Tax=Ottowia testudinis TaxID=2816950 RepID=A0A975CHD4_9BURK|nr:copper resistance protein B [Ottowia testudinis]QTD44947.1 copper resistance protein B [Ottowia testudinis]